LAEGVVQTVASFQVVIAATLFLACYAFIVAEKIDRSIIALSGAVLMIVFGIVDFQTAFTKHVHWETIFLLIGMMMLVGLSSKSGIFEYLALKTAQSAKGNPKRILIRLAILTAVGAAFIDNVTMVLLVAPVTIAIANRLHLKATPFLITEILLCNIGGTATLVGDPPNIMIGTAAGLSFNDFLIHLTPVVLVLAVLVIVCCSLYYAKHLKIDDEHKDLLMNEDPRDYISDFGLAKKAVVVFSLTLLGFFLHNLLHLEPAVVALAGGTLLMLLGAKSYKAEKVFQSVEWVTIFFFVGLFVLVGGLVEVGIIQQLASGMLAITNNNLTQTTFILLWGAGIASSIVDNIPLVATTIPLVQDMSSQLSLSASETAPLWWALSLGACLGGNGTLIAASANLIVANIAAREGNPISFIDFLKVSVPITLGTLVIASVYVYFVIILLGFA